MITSLSRVTFRWAGALADGAAEACILCVKRAHAAAWGTTSQGERWVIDQSAINPTVRRPPSEIGLYYVPLQKPLKFIGHEARP